jgi:hypothetical protein
MRATPAEEPMERSEPPTPAVSVTNSHLAMAHLRGHWEDCEEEQQSVPLHEFDLFEGVQHHVGAVCAFAFLPDHQGGDVAKGVKAPPAMAAHT